MEQIFETHSFTEKNVLKAWADYNNETNIQYTKHINQKIGFLLELVNSLNEEKVELEEWKVWSKPLLFKLTFHVGSFLKLFSGTSLDLKNQQLTIFDEPTVLIMFRVIMENYLTFYYLYCDNISDEEKSFRINVWKYSGLKQRSTFRVTTEASKKKMQNEQQEIMILQKVINESPFFNSFAKDEKKLILKGVKPRLMNSWGQLNNLSGFQVDLFKNLYGFKSNYSHSEFISVMQVNSINYDFNPNAKEHYTLLLVHSLLSKCIIDLTKIFPSIKKQFDKQDIALIKEINFLNQLAKQENL